MTSVDLTMLLQGTTVADQIGYHTAFERMVETGELAGYHAVPYRSARTSDDWVRLWTSVVDHMTAHGSNALHLQYFHLRGAPDPRPWIEQIRALPQAPVVTTSCGDPFGGPFASPPASLLRAASVADATFTTSMGWLADRLERAGGRRITLVPNGACDIRFASGPARTPAEPDFDVVFIGSRHPVRNPLSGFARQVRRRSAYVERLARRYGSRFGLFGAGWDGVPGWQGPLSFDRQLDVCARAQVVFGGVPHSTCTFYTSDRVFNQAMAGVAMVDRRVPGVEVFLEDGVEWLLFSGLADALRAIDAVLDGTLDGPAIGRRAAEAVRVRHLASHRAGLIVRIVRALVEARTHGDVPSCPPLGYLRGDLAPEWHRAAARW